MAAAEVSVDVGHGNFDSGAISARGRSEYDFNRTLAVPVERALRQRGLLVRRINEDGDTWLADRPEAALGSDFFLSLHHDSVQPEELETWQVNGEEQTYSDAHRGFSLFISRRNPDPAASLRCASAIGAELLAAGFIKATHHTTTAAGTPRPWADEANGVRYYDTLLVLGRTAMPAVLLEAGVIKHRQEELELADPARQERMAAAVAAAVTACLRWARISVPDPASAVPMPDELQRPR